MKIGKRIVLAIAVAIVVVTLIIFFLYPWYCRRAFYRGTVRMIHEPHPLFHGGRKLLEGLVYYDEGYSINPEYDERIEALMQKGNEKTE